MTLSRNFGLLGIVWVLVVSNVFGQDPLPLTHQKWQDRLPVSLNGKLPDELPLKFEESYWHSLRASPGAPLRFDVELRPNKNPLFADPMLQDLCQSILISDLATMKELLAKGVDVNGRGVGNITPLLVAFFHDTDPRPFELLLSHGADPNVMSDSPPQPFSNFTQRTVANLAAIPQYNRLFKRTYQGNGGASKKGNANQFFGLHFPPFEYGTMNQPDGLARLKLLASLKVDFDQEVRDGFRNFLFNLLARSVSEIDHVKREHNYQLASILIESGSEYSKYLNHPGYVRWYPDGEDFRFCKFKPMHLLAHTLLVQELDIDLPENANFNKLVKVFEEDHLNLEVAKDDLKRWLNWRESGLANLILIEARIRETQNVDVLQQWLDGGVEREIARLEKNGDRWGRPSSAISYYPTTLRRRYGVEPKLGKYWNDIIESELIDRRTIRKWKEEKIFSDPRVEALKSAMFDHNISEMERLIVTEGVDVNAIGKDKLSLVYLATCVANDPRPLELLLRHKASPNVINDAEHKQRGLAAVHLIAKTKYCRLFRTIFEKGGDPNLVAKGKSCIGFIPSDCTDWKWRVEILCRKGADVNKAHSDQSLAEVLVKETYFFVKRHPPRSFPPMRGPDPNFFLALRLGAAYDFSLKDELSVPKYPSAGDDVRRGQCWLRLPHLVLEIHPGIKNYDPLAVWLEKKGFSLDDARSDLARWKKWIEDGTPELVQQEHARRKASP